MSQFQVLMKGHSMQGPVLIGTDKNVQMHMIRINNKEQSNFDESLLTNTIPINIQINKPPIAVNDLGASCLGVVTMKCINEEDYSQAASLQEQDIDYKCTDKDLKNLTYLEELDHDQSLKEYCLYLLKLNL